MYSALAVESIALDIAWEGSIYESYRLAGDGIPEMYFDNNSFPTSLSCGFQRAVTDKARLKPGSSSTLVTVAFPIIVSLAKR